MSRIKTIDEHFLEERNRDPLELKRGYYILMLYSGYTPQGKNGIEFRSKDKDLANVIIREFGVPKNRVSNW